MSNLDKKFHRKQKSKLNATEKKILNTHLAGKTVQLNEKRPNYPDLGHTVSAEFVRGVLLGFYGQASQTFGLHLIGLFITGTLNLKRCHIDGSLTFENCHFENEPQLHYAKFSGSLIFDGSRVPGLRADGIHVNGEVHFRRGFESYGELRLLSGVFGGNLSFRGALLCNSANEQNSLALPITNSVDQVDALCLDRATVAGNLLLDGHINVIGKVRLTETTIGNSLVIEDARLDAGNQDYALSLSRCKVGGTLILRRLNVKRGTINLGGAKTFLFDDDQSAWIKNINLNNFVYTFFSNTSKNNAEERLSWLQYQSDEALGYMPDTGQSIKNPSTYTPQPWNQLIKTLRESGYKSESISLAIARERHERAIDKMFRVKNNKRTFRGAIAISLHWIFEKIAGYGYRPSRLVATLGIIWLASAAFYWWAALMGVFAPSSPLIFDSPKYIACRSTPSLKANWYLCADLASEFTTFSPLVYSLDLVLPLVDLGQAKDWGVIIRTPYDNPIKELIEFDFEHIVRLITWLEILSGWVISLLFVASLSGLAQKSESH